MADPTAERLLLTMDEAAALLSISPRKVGELVRRREMPSVRIGRSVRVPRAHLVAWVDGLVVHSNGTQSTSGPDVDVRAFGPGRPRTGLGQPR